MALPEGFTDFEHLQDTIRLLQNRIVRDEFSDLGGDDWEPNINGGRPSLRQACTIKDSDTASMVEMRLFLYYIILRKAKDLHPAIYGIPTTGFQEQRKFKPQIMLFFQEDSNDVEPGYSPVTGEISFRIMNEETETITMSNIQNFANKVKSAFATPSFVWKKGKELYSYTDWKKGYQLQLLCRNQTEAKRVVEQVLDIQSHTPDWKKLAINTNAEPSEAFPTIPPNQTILGKSHKLPRKRPIADARFQYGLLHLHGLPNSICLVDRTGTYSNPQVAA
jgi:hypothetical protein